MQTKNKRRLLDVLLNLRHARREQLDRHPVPGDYHGLRLQEELAALEWAIELAEENERG